MGGMAEEYFHLGQSLAQTGHFMPDKNIAYVFRPPGYPAFIAGVIKLRQLFPGSLPSVTDVNGLSYTNALHRSVYYAQCLLLSFSTVLLFIWLSAYFKSVNAIFISALFALNPYLYILTGLLHYEILHIFLTILSCFALTRAFRDQKIHTAGLLMAGSLWGLTTLVRPMTIILPAFVLIMGVIHFRPFFNKSIKAAFFLTLGMAITISPYTIRNYCLTKTLIPVNAQGGAALWVGTIVKVNKNPNYYDFWTLMDNKKVKQQQAELFQKAAKEKEPQDFGKFFRIFLKNNVAFDRVYKEKAIDNILQHPEIYSYNLIQNFLTYNLDINSIFIDLFQANNHYSGIQPLNLKHCIHGIPQNIKFNSMSTAFAYLIYVLSGLGLLGILTGVLNKNGFLLVPFTIYLCFGVAHAITYMDLMYYYIKIPFLYIFAGYFIDFTARYKLQISF